MAGTSVTRFGGQGNVACRRCLRLFLIIALLGVLAWLAGWGQLPAGSDRGLALLLAVSLLYALLLAVPFVPSVEIGLLIMLLYGRPGIIAAYVATLLGLNLAYLAGRFLRGQAGMVQRMEERLLRRIRRPGGKPLLAVFVLATLLNTPGNTAVGGGGGISLVYGAAGLLPWGVFAACVAVATALIPTLVFLGMLGAEQLMLPST